MENTNNKGNYYLENSEPSNDGVFETKKALSNKKEDNIISTIGNIKGILEPSELLVPSEKDKYSSEEAMAMSMKNLSSGVAGKFYGNHRTDESYLDESITDLRKLDEGYSMNNLRGEQQGGLMQLGAGLTKAVVLTGTTLANAFGGLVFGATEAATGGSFVNNFFSTAMANINEWSEEVFKNYYTKEQEEAPWYEQIFTTNFIGDKLIKNLGFVAGSVLAGNVTAGLMSKALQLNKVRNVFKGAVSEANSAGEAFAGALSGKAIDAKKVVDNLSNSAKSLRWKNKVLEATSTLVGAAGEASLEAVQNSKDWEQTQLANLERFRPQLEKDEYKQLIKERPELLIRDSRDIEGMTVTLSDYGMQELQKRVESKYNEGVKKIAEDRYRMANVDYLGNLALLWGTNSFQYGKYFSRGYKSAQKAKQIANKVVSKTGEASYEAVKRTPTWLKSTGKAISKPIVEGSEEMNQQAITLASGYMYSSDLNSFYGAKVDPSVEKENINFIQAIGKGIADTYGDGKQWEQFFIGALMGGIGVPVFRSSKSNDGKFRSPLSFQYGSLQAIKEVREERRKNDEIITQLNTWAQDPLRQEYYANLNRQFKYDRNKAEALDNNDQFEFKNAEHSQLISDIVLFSKAGRVQDLLDQADGMKNLSEEDIESIKQLGTKTDGSESIWDTMTDDEVKQAMYNKAVEYESLIKNYKKIAEDLTTFQGQNFSSDGLDELIWMTSSIKDWEQRFESIHKKVKTKAQEVIDSKTFEAVEVAADTESKKVSIEDILNKTTNELMHLMADENTGVKELLTKLNEATDNVTGLGELMTNLEDLQKIAKARLEFIVKTNRFINNPTLIQKKLDDTKKNAIKDKIEGEITPLNESLDKATTFGEVQMILDEANSLEEMDDNKIEELLKNNKNSILVDYLKSKRFFNNIQKKLNLEDHVDKTINSILVKAFEKATSIDELDDIESLIAKETSLSPELSSLVDIRLSELVVSYYSANDMQDALEEYTPPEENEQGEEVAIVTNNGVITTKKEHTKSIQLDIPFEEESTEKSIKSSTTKAQTELEKEVSTNIDETIDHSEESISTTNLEWIAAIPQLSLEGKRDGSYRTFKEQYPGFATLFDYIDNKGGFAYVNDGLLKENDDIYFAIDPKLVLKYNDRTGKEIESTPILIIKKEANETIQILNVLKESNTSEDLSKTIKEVRDEYAAAQKKGLDNTNLSNGYFVASPKTKVASIKNGVVPKGTSFKNNVKNIPFFPNKDNLKLGIMKQGAILTGDLEVDKQIRNIKVPFGSEGKLFILIKGPKENYLAEPIRARVFSQSDYNIENYIDSLFFQKEIIPLLMLLADSKSNDDIAKILRNQTALYIPKNVHINILENKGDISLEISQYELGHNREVLYEEDNKTPKKKKKFVIRFQKVNRELGVVTDTGFIPSETVVTSSLEERILDILDAIYQLELLIQISIKNLNNPNYLSRILENDLISTPILEARTLSSWFTLQAINPKTGKPFANKKGINTPIDKSVIGEVEDISTGNNDKLIDEVSKIDSRDKESLEVRPTTSKVKRRLPTLKDSDSKITKTPKKVIKKMEKGLENSKRDSIFVDPEIDQGGLPTNASINKHIADMLNITEEEFSKLSEEEINKRIECHLK